MRDSFDVLAKAGAAIQWAPEQEALFQRALNRVQMLEIELRQYVTNDDDPDPTMAGQSQLCIVYRKRWVHSRALLGIGGWSGQGVPLRDDDC